MILLKDRLLRAGCCLMAVVAGAAGPVAAEQERDNPPAFSYLLHLSLIHI